MYHSVSAITEVSGDVEAFTVHPIEDARMPCMRAGIRSRIVRETAAAPPMKLSNRSAAGDPSERLRASGCLGGSLPPRGSVPSEGALAPFLGEASSVTRPTLGLLETTA